MSARYASVVTVMIFLTSVIACGKAEPTATPISTTETPLPPSAEPQDDAPMPTPVPPTAIETSVPTATSKPPSTVTPTPLPPTATETSVPTATSEPPSTATPTSLPALSEIGAGMIAFVSDRDGDDEIYLMGLPGPQGGELRTYQLTDNTHDDSIPDWSPDGTQIAFASTRDGNWELYVMDVTGDLLGADVAGANLRRLTDHESEDTLPSWSPDGSQIAFSSDRDGNWEIYVVDADGKNLRRLTHNPDIDMKPSWSPDGKQIVFDSGSGYNRQVFVMDADGSNRRLLARADGGWPAWSPDGTQIAYFGRTDGNPEIYVVNADGTSGRRMTNNRADDWEPSWSPDGEWILFVSGRTTDIFVIRADGSETHRLTHDGYANWVPVWRPSITSYVPVFEPDLCRFSPPNGYEVTCGYLVVPENRAKPEGPSIRIHVAIFKSANPHPKPDPVIYVAGGGGVNQLGSSGYYLNSGGNDILRDRDYIMFNQRGAHLNEPSLVCPDDTDLFWELAKQDLTPHERADRRIERRLECHDDLLQQGIDLSAYNTVETAADVNDLRIALGYDKVNLYGTSSGTRTILTVMRDHPGGVRSVILDSVFPPQVNLYSTYSLSAHRVFSLLFQACAADPECNQRYPDLEATLYQTVDDLNANPASVQLSRGTVLVDGGFFMDAIYVSFFSTRNIPLIPRWIDRASQGDLTGLHGTLEGLLSDSGTFMAMGFEWSMMCNEEVPFESYALGRELAADLPPQIAEYFDSYYEFTLCESWQSGRADPIENTAVVSDIPALIFAGQFDPVTPPEWGRLAAETLSHHFFFEFPGLGHGVMRSNQCGLEIGLQFIDDPTTEPDASCIDELTAPDFK